ncbi:MAG TPA: glycosyltransferase [Devosia sp.]|jgi:glycosyltransferase involved in cell wall biosynthesis|uniref:glycosyltransferase n=1 Tax=Devosia sp. TaxID=1871048 RepID=UPI002DDD1949|nr:glycosyltransferase [Devosia sp.]HEV2518038.1 glycosyltransferase [Devosia sp.]
MPRLVFHVPSCRGGGAERVFVLMANEMARRGHEVTLFVWNSEGPNAALRADDVKLVDLGMPIYGEGFGKPATLSGLRRSASFYRRLKPDAVFSGPEFANLITALALSLGFSKAKFFPSFHAAAGIPSNDFGSKIAVLLAGLVAARATRAIAVSAGVGRDIAARGIAAEKVAVIYNPLPPALQRPAVNYPWQAELAALGHGPVIATAGRLVGVKDHKTLLRAFARLLQSRPARLVLFGEGPMLGELEAESRTLGIASKVLFAGYVNDPMACYAAADLFALSSTSEGFGNVLIEAMAAGVPVVSTDAPHGPREILADGTYGALVPVGDAEALAGAMAAMLDKPTDPALLKGRAAEFEIERIGDMYEGLLR